MTVSLQDSSICSELEEAEVTLGSEGSTANSQSLGASIRPVDVDFMRHEAATPDKPDFQRGVDSTFQKPPYLCFLQAEIWKAAKNLAKDLFCI